VQAAVVRMDTSGFKLLPAAVCMCQCIGERNSNILIATIYMPQGDRMTELDQTMLSKTWQAPGQGGIDSPTGFDDDDGLDAVALRRWRNFWCLLLHLFDSWKLHTKRRELVLGPYSSSQLINGAGAQVVYVLAGT
jgi:hypothetical protein